ncbi:hypothetical protein ATO7_06605 [Oceanococcus atlanticus]|uniref:DUF1643 domain-containing protein n=1 Tax=Oceanococcus atlanticus TaxID=1317117 RepID=A0A1Y1SJH7_9GAMM|nr:DUF1643 domain-containing protein [Oceanococcus atlanticus]ORE89530.1 hypothetical protein ATO7_06605 [Oceanococcus atlanticus]
MQRIDLSLTMSSLQPWRHSEARFSPCGAYRYRLWRIWGEGEPQRRLCMIMLNPSTADEFKNDPTVERCCRRARMWGYDRLDVVNIFALRSTDPQGLYLCDDPVGEDNDAAILEAAREADLAVAAWGNHGRLGGRGGHVLAMLKSAGVELHAFKLSQVGEPVHPLYQPYSALPQPL